MSSPPESGEWVELAVGYYKSSVRALAEAELIRVGLSPEELSPDELRLDIGQDTELRDFFRVRVRKSVLERGRPT